MTPWLEWLLTDLGAAAAVLLVRRWLWQPILVKGSSMQPAYQGGEWLWASRLALKRRGLGRGDVVICHYPGRTWKHCKWVKLLFIKRVVGLPGETISVEDGVTMINGEPLEEPYLDPKRCGWRRDMPPCRIREDEVFLMGDHRNVSHDCRRIGPLKQRMLVALVMGRLWPIRRKQAEKTENMS